MKEENEKDKKKKSNKNKILKISCNIGGEITFG